MSEIKVVANTQDALGEVPIWCDRTSRLWWVDVVKFQLHNLDPATGMVSSVSIRGGRLGSIALRESGGLLLATGEGVDVYDPATGQQQRFVGKDMLPARERFNDGRCDRQGRFWVGSMHLDYKQEGALFRVDPDGAISRHLDGIIVSNSIATSPDSRTFYFADTRQFTIWSFDFDAAAGTLSNRRVFARTSGEAGRPDGSCCDADGYLWNAEYAGGRVVRYAPDGRIDRVITLPAMYPTSLCFGGPGFETLFITSARQALTPEEAGRDRLAGAVFSLEPGVRGLPEPRFRG